MCMRMYQYELVWTVNRGQWQEMMATNEDKLHAYCTIYQVMLKVDITQSNTTGNNSSVIS